LVSTERVCDAERVGGARGASAAAAAVADDVVARELPDWPSGTPLPTREVLLTLLWVLRVEEGKRVAKESGVMTVKEKMAAKKRSREEETRAAPIKRRRGQ